MNNTIKYILFAFAGLLASQSLLCAQTYTDDEIETIKLYKTIEPVSEGNFRINLEAFVTGASEVTTSAKPVDVALVLDMSQSMLDELRVARPSASYSYNSINNGTYYYKYGDNYYEVSRGGESSARYLRYYRNGWRYLYGTQSYNSSSGHTVSGNNTTIYTGVLYQDVSKLNLLKDAVKSFIDIIADNAKGRDGRAGTDDDVAHRISIIKFASSNQSSVIPVNGVAGLVDVGDGSALKTAVTNLTNGTYTRSDTGMNLALGVMNGVTRESSKVVVMFTDGVPTESGWGTTFDDDVANRAIGYSKTLKGNTIGANVYTIGIFDTETTDIRTYMNYVSSNYPNASNMTTPGTGGDVTKGFYQLSDGSDLSDIFKGIASDVSSEVIDLHSSSASVIDIVSNNFKLPASVVANPSLITLSIEKVNGYDASKKDVDFYEDETTHKKYYYGFTFEPDADYYNAHTPSVSVPAAPAGQQPNTVNVTGFDFGLQDVVNETTGDITYGNFVGNRTVNDVSIPAGRKLVISFPIELNSDYQGGYSMPSNDIQSGIYIGDELVKPFPVPTTDFPSICIVKHGLLPGESAIFKVTGSYKENEDDENSPTVSYNVVLTQKTDAAGNLLPCYAVLKRLYSGKYKVEETNWSWMYVADNNVNGGARMLEYDILPADQVGVDQELLKAGNDLVNGGNVVGKTATKTVGSVLMPFVMLKDSQGEYIDSAISILYEFGNVRKTAGKPARGESWKNNKFKGGTNNTGTTEGGVVEEENL